MQEKAAVPGDSNSVTAGEKVFSNTEARSIFSFGISRAALFFTAFFALVKNEYGLAAIAGGVLLLIFGTKLWSRAAAARLNVSVFMNKNRLFPDESLQLSVEIENRKLLPVWVRIKMNTPKLLDTGKDEPLGSETGLLSWEKRTRQWSMKAVNRGAAVLEQARVDCGDLLGLHLRRLHISLPGELIVFPRLGELMPLHIPFQEYFGIHPSKGPVEDPAWYAGTRDYTGNRPAKNIHWKASARLARLQEKLYEPTSHRKVLLVLDTSGFPQTGDTFPYVETPPEEHVTFEHLISATATLANALMETGASFGLVTNAVLNGPHPQVLQVGRGPEQLGILLEMLARVEGGTQGDLSELLTGMVRGDLGIIYFGSGPGQEAHRLVDSASPRRMRIFFIFSHPPVELDEDVGEKNFGQPSLLYWKGFPAYDAREVVHVR